MGNLLRRKSATTGVVPTSLEYGQIAINYADGLIFWKDATGTIRSTTLYPAAIDSPEFLGNPRRADALSGSDDSNSLTTSAWVRSAIAALAGAVSQAWGTISGTPTTLSGYGITDAIPSSEKGAANGVATLGADSKIPEAQLPALAITDVFEAASQSAMLALTAERGDVCVRSDLNKSYVLSATPASTLANWKELRTPTDAVLSVAGMTGAVALASTNLTDGTAAGRAVFTAANEAAQRTALGLGTAATAATGVSGATVPLQNAAANFSKRVTAERFGPGYTLVIADDAAGSLVFDIDAAGSAIGYIEVVCLTNPAAAVPNGKWRIRAGATPAIDQLSKISGANVAVTTGVLSGTTGTDGSFTISAHTDGKVYFENRSGSSKTIRVSVSEGTGL